MKILGLLTLTLALVGCNDTDRAENYQQGYNDGYATGYNENCVPRVTIVYGYWDKTGYREGFNAGRTIGAQACYVCRNSNPNNYDACR